MSRNICLHISYDGTRYLGWQKLGTPGSSQYNKTIQGKLESLLEKMTGEVIELHGSGRTDAGVHAADQTANFHTECTMTETEMLAYINRYLPDDIAVNSLHEAAPRFHARLNAKAKTYCYTVRNSTVPDVFRHRYEYTVSAPLDIAAMRSAAGLLCGTHDFRNFCSSKRTKKSTVRTLYSINFEQHGPLLCIYFRGNGFLYNMVRILTGTLLEIGTGQRAIDTLPILFDAEKRTPAGYTAPPHGLMLMNVEY